ncbi:MAG: 30S ribosomal protein S4e [Thaumarchaeota archaeon]|nr:30S ribosomal protein S4e [Nitrososphaerota archaeon]|tara:strand:+ start:3445 stop:4173 length:729 start_codon:yes stop_codon:yes gene_type:complete
MGKKAGSKILKRTMSPSFWQIERKNKRFVTKPSSGSHPSKQSIPLTVLLRDILKLTKTYSETKIIIREGQVKVDSRIRKDPNYPVGLMDVVEIIKTDSIYRLVPSKKFLSPIIIPDNEKDVKLCKVVNKSSVDKETFQYSFHDGRTMNIASSTNVPVGSTFKISLPSQKVEKIIEIKVNNLVVLTGGQNKGLIGTIKDIKESSFSRPRMIDIDADNRAIEVKADLVMTIGEKTSELTLKGDE